MTDNNRMGRHVFVFITLKLSVCKAVIALGKTENGSDLMT
jgi:hypothetical protein